MSTNTPTPAPAAARTKYTPEEWLAEAERRFGANQFDWKFVCPVCKHVFSVRDWNEAGAPPSCVAFSCVGRWYADSAEAFPSGSPKRTRAFSEHGCNYAGGGLFKLNPVTVTYPDGHDTQVFDFAEATE